MVTTKSREEPDEMGKMLTVFFIIDLKTPHGNRPSPVKIWTARRSVR